MDKIPNALLTLAIIVNIWIVGFILAQSIITKIIMFVAIVMFTTFAMALTKKLR